MSSFHVKQVIYVKFSRETYRRLHHYPKKEQSLLHENDPKITCQTMSVQKCMPTAAKNP